VPISGTADTDVSQVTVTLTDHLSASVSQPNVSVIGGLWSTWIDASGLADGSITVEASGEDTFGNDGSSSPKSTIKDTTPPDVDFTDWTNPIDYDTAPAAWANGTSENGALIELTVTDQHGHSTGNSVYVSGGVWSIGALDLTSFADGDVITYSVVATDSFGNSTLPGEHDVTATKYTGPVPPDPPTNVVGDPGPARILVTWEPPADDGRDPIQDYTVTAVEDPTKTCIGYPVEEPELPSCEVLYLDSATAYTFTVTARNGYGTSDPSEPSDPATPLSANTPDRPTGVTGHGLNGAAQISWVAPAYDGGWPISGYTVTSTPGGFTCTTTGALTCKVTGLTNKIGYTFKVKAKNIAGTGPESSASKTIIPRQGHTYFGLTPTRILDTYAGIQRSTPLQPLKAYTFQVTNRFPSDPTRNVPSNATAVTGTLSVSRCPIAAYLALTPDPIDVPTTSTLNFPANDTRATGATITLGPGGTLSVTYGGTTSGTAHVAFDVTGYYVEGTLGSTYIALTPARVLDSRKGLGQPGGVATKFANGVPQSFQVAGASVGGVPSWAIAVTGNLTVTRQTSAGFVSLTPEANANPPTATVYSPKYSSNNKDNRAAAVTMKLGADGTLSAVWKGATGSTADVIFDVNGYFVAGASGATYVPLTPNRILDTRKTGKPVQQGISRLYGLVGVSFWVVNRGFVDPENPGAGLDPALNVPPAATGVTGILTVTRQQKEGYLSLTPTVINIPTTSTLNFLRDNRATGVVVPLGSGKLGITYAPTRYVYTHVVFDVSGYFLP